MKWELDDLAGASDLADEYSVSRPTISMWARRYDDFPQPLAHIGTRPVYSRRQVAVWWKSKRWYVWQRTRYQKEEA